MQRLTGKSFFVTNGTGTVCEGRTELAKFTYQKIEIIDENKFQHWERDEKERKCFVGQFYICDSKILIGNLFLIANCKFEVCPMQTGENLKNFTSMRTPTCLIAKGCIQMERNGLLKVQRNPEWRTKEI